MRRWWVAAVVVVALGFAPPVAAGLFGGGPPGRIPIPARVFDAEVEDVGGTVLQISRVTFDGEIYLFGTIGEAQVTVPFDGIQVAVFSAGPDEEHRTVAVTDANGETVQLVVEEDRPLYGRTAFGNYKIEAGDVRRIRLLGETRTD